MSNYRAILISLGWRLLLGAAVYAFGWRVLVSTEGGFGAISELLAGMAFLVLAAVIVAPPLARLVAEPSGRLFYPARRFRRPQPLYSVAQSKRKAGRMEEAFDAYLAISRDHPQKLKPYVEMMDIAVVDMGNAELAGSIFRGALKTLKKETDQDALTRMYEAIISRANAPSRNPRRVVSRSKVPAKSVKSTVFQPHGGRI